MFTRFQNFSWYLVVSTRIRVIQRLDDFSCLWYGYRLEKKCIWNMIDCRQYLSFFIDVIFIATICRVYVIIIKYVGNFRCIRYYFIIMFYTCNVMLSKSTFVFFFNKLPWSLADILIIIYILLCWIYLLLQFFCAVGFFRV